MNGKLSKFTLWMVYLSLGLGIVFLLSLPWTLPVVLLLPDFLPEHTPVYYGALFCWVAASLLLNYIFVTLLGMMKSLDGDPFVKINVQRLGHMGIAALIMGGFLAVSAVLYPRPMLFAIACTACLCGLFSLVLRGVFAKAVDYREENALTI